MQKLKPVVFGAAVLFVFGASAHGQGRPAAPSTSMLPRPAVNVQIDDQLFDVADQIPPGQDTSRPQGATVDSNGFGWRFKFQGWEGGVVPVEFAADVTAVQRAQFMRICTGWSRVTPIACVAHTSQSGYLKVTEAVAEQDVASPSPCWSNVGQNRRLVKYETHLGLGCWTDSLVYHEFGHALGFFHEHQRPDRDTYLTIDLGPVPENARFAFAKINTAASGILLQDQLGPYDFLSIMHYPNNAFSTDPNRFSMLANPGYGSFANTMGRSTQPTDADHVALQHLYAAYNRPLNVTAPAESPRARFDRADFLDAMERLHAYYISPMGLVRSGGLAINGGPDFLGLATWIFDVYLAARSRGFAADQSFGIVVADITQTDEWRAKHPGQQPLTRPSFNALVNFDRGEFLDVLQRLDGFYRAPEGLQRPNGLSISGGPDFLGIATWMFDVYLNERLSGGSPNVAWTRVVNAIQSTDEWRQKH